MEAVGWHNDWVRFKALPYPGDALDQPIRVYEALCVSIEAQSAAEVDLANRNRTKPDE